LAILKRGSCHLILGKTESLVSSDGGSDQPTMTMHRSLTIKNVLGGASHSDCFVTCGADCFLCISKRTRDGEVPPINRTGRIEYFTLLDEASPLSERHEGMEACEHNQCGGFAATSVKKLDWSEDQTGPRSSLELNHESRAAKIHHIELMLPARANALGFVSAGPDAHAFALKPARDQAHLASQQMPSSRFPRTVRRTSFRIRRPDSQGAAPMVRLLSSTVPTRSNPLPTEGSREILSRIGELFPCGSLLLAADSREATPRRFVPSVYDLSKLSCFSRPSNVCAPVDVKRRHTLSDRSSEGPDAIAEMAHAIKSQLPISNSGFFITSELAFAVPHRARPPEEILNRIGNRSLCPTERATLESGGRRSARSLQKGRERLMHRRSVRSRECRPTDRRILDLCNQQQCHFSVLLFV
jgi:hypothetical protein